MSPTLSRQLLAFAPLACALAHITEEFIFPGGFVSWYRRYRPAYSASITPTHLFRINAVLLGVAALVAFEGLSWASGPALWLTLAAVLGANGLWHVVGAIRTKSYSPGVITGVLLYMPMLVVGAAYLIHAALIGVGSALLPVVIGASYQLWSDRLHRLRSR